MSALYEGFIVHASFPKNKRSARLYFVGRLQNGETFAVVEERERPTFYIRESERGPAEQFLPGEGVHFDSSPYTTFDGERCMLVSCDTVWQFQQAFQLLGERSVRTYEGDIRYTDQFLMSRGIHGSVTIEGSSMRGRYVDHVFVNPELSPSEWQPSLTLLSIDIETNPFGGEIFAISLVQRAPDVEERQEVLFAGSIDGGCDTSDHITLFDTEESMLQAFCSRVMECDPDIITGWNVIDFDFSVIAGRMKKYGIDFHIGRSDAPAAYLPGEKGRSNTVIVPGRQVMDGVRLVRAGPSRYEDYTLESVASAELGRGKILEQLDGENKLEAIVRLHEQDPVSLCRYCLEDARLVLDILGSTGLVDLTVKKCMLTGVGLDRAWTSIHAFDYLYIEALHKRGIVAPSTGVDLLPPTDAPGGAILQPQTGLYDNVWIFDFKSLYPTIIRTFNIDPLSFVLPGHVEQLSEEEKGLLIRAPNGSCFRRDRAILPGLLERFFKNRETAKAENDSVASHVYKIIMNSFYGVLGARGARFASGLISGAITSFGQYLLGWCRDFIEDKGYTVLYGDTDSLFVLSGMPVDSSEQAIEHRSMALCHRINDALKQFIEKTYAVHSYLELEYEKTYFRFFLPPVRNTPASESNSFRGRAKGYAGLLVPAGRIVRDDVGGTDPSHIEIRGMEAVRRDWTDLAKGFQIGLLMLVFRNTGLDEIKSFIRSVQNDLFDGKLDTRLVYRKALRKPVSQYTHAQPPHVRAAAMLDPRDQRGLISYIWSVDGPQPVEKMTAPPDYVHYVDKQLKPICQSFTDVLHTDIQSLFGGKEQLELF
jgi:DNA polymerase-2